MSEPRYQSAADVIDGWRDEVLNGIPPVLYPCGSGDLARIQIGPGLVTLFGGAPGQGKSAFTSQLVFDALGLTPSLRALICSVEMSPGVLLDRQLARLANIDLTDIRYRRIGADDSERLEAGMDALECLSDRLAFVRPPFDLANVAASADAFDAQVIVLDYIQRIGPPGEHGDRRGSVDATMGYLREFADAGTAIIVVAAVSRSRDSKGRSSYSEGLNLASFRESSELEFGADDAFILAPGDDSEDPASSRVILKHLKSRHGETKDISLHFDRKHQRFTPVDSGLPQVSRVARPKNQTDRSRQAKFKAALNTSWKSTTPSHNDEDLQ